MKKEFGYTCPENLYKKCKFYGINSNIILQFDNWLMIETDWRSEFTQRPVLRPLYLISYNLIGRAISIIKTINQLNNNKKSQTSLQTQKE